MSNVLLEPIPTKWNGYQVNTWWQIGVQISLLMDDEDIPEEDKTPYIVYLLFGNEDGTLREFPRDPNELSECIGWFMGGWNYDHSPKQEDDIRIMDFEVDQWRIYADFRQIYGINLNEETDLHWWEFCGMLWNMPRDKSSFKQVIEIRTKKPSKKASAEEKKAIADGKKIYGLGKKKVHKAYTEEELSKIDEFDRMMEEAQKEKETQLEALEEFRK